jgi:hypothetical protein
MNHRGLAEYDDIAFQNIEEVSAGGSRLLRIKGLIMHSSIVADHVDLHHEQHAVHVLVSMALTRPGKSGLFELYIPIPDRISLVTFGKEKKALWKRELDVLSEPAFPLANQNFG